MSRSQTITDAAWSDDPAEWLHNPHAGELLASEFMVPLKMDATHLAHAIHVPTEQIEAVLDGSEPMDGTLDLRLARYFGMSAGFFLRLQNSYQLVQARRALVGELDRIVPRAA